MWTPPSPAPTVPPDESTSGSRLLIVSNRLPVTVKRDGKRVSVERSSGGLASGLRSPHERSQGWWIGWPGDLTGLGASTRAEALHQLRQLRTIPVTLSRDEIAVFYEELSNGILWPLCHDRVDRLPLRMGGWDVYERINARFADTVAQKWRPGDDIWVHDYQLMRLPALLRERLPEARIGFFLH